MLMQSASLGWHMRMQWQPGDPFDVTQPDTGHRQNWAPFHARYTLSMPGHERATIY